MATIVDVARRAAVAPATVSNVIWGKRPVSAETSRRVRAAIEELGYRPNLVARGLVQQRTNTLGLLLQKLSNPFYTEVAQEVERIVRAAGYHLFLMSTGDDAAMDRTYLEALLGRQIDGLLVAAGSARLADVEAVVRGRVPSVVLAEEEGHPASSMPAIAIDFGHAGVLAARHLLDLGHRRLGVVPELPFHQDRLDGFCRALAAAGIEMPGGYVRGGASTVESGYAAAAALLDLPERPTAIFATNDLMALGALEAAADAGLRVPDDLSVVGLDDIMLASHVRPALTTVAVPKQRLAAEATELLLRLIEHAEQTSTRRMLQPHLVIRRSTGRVPAPDGTRGHGEGG